MLAKAAEKFPSIAILSDDSHSARLVVKHIHKQIEGIGIHGKKNVASSFKAIAEMGGSVSL